MFGYTEAVDSEISPYKGPYDETAYLFVSNIREAF